MRVIVHPELSRFRVRAGEYGTDDDMGNNGAFHVPAGGKKLVRVIASEGNDEIPWEHVSVSLPDRCPTWDEMSRVKNLFWSDDECVIQYHPPISEYINNHPYCLHLWKPKLFDLILPPRIAVGLKCLGTMEPTP